MRREEFDREEFDWEWEFITKPALKEVAKTILFIWLVISILVYVTWWLLASGINLPKPSFLSSLGFGVIISFVILLMPLPRKK